MTGRVLRERRTHHIPDLGAVPNLSPTLRDRVNRHGGASLLYAPMLWEDSGLGSIVVVRWPPRPFSDREQALLQTFADQAAIAIENARMFEEVQAKTRDLTEALQQQTATADVLKLISRSAFDLQAVLDTLTSSAATLCEAEKASIFQRRGELYHFVANFGFTDDLVAYARAHPMTPGASGGVARTARDGRAVHIPDVLADPEYEQAGYQSRGDYRTLLTAPMLRQGEPIGAFVMTRQAVRPFNPRQIELLQTFADQAVIAIENVRLFDEVQAKTRDLEEALQQQTATSNVLQVISRSAFDLQAVLTTLAELARDLCGASFVTLFMRDGDAMRLRAELGCTPEIVKFLHEHPIRAGRETFTGRVMLSGEAVHLTDVLADPEYNFGDAPRIGNYRALLGVPLLRNGQVEGVFALARPEPSPFSGRQIEMVRAFVDQALIAVENARLFSEVQARTQRPCRVAEAADGDRRGAEGDQPVGVRSASRAGHADPLRLRALATPIADHLRPRRRRLPAARNVGAASGVAGP